MFDTNLTFDDVSLVPQYSEIASRHDVDLSCGEEFDVKMTSPILSANMATVTGEEMCRAMLEVGCLGVQHRFQSLEDFEIPLNYKKIVSIGVDGFKERLEFYRKNGLNLLCIDVAHGHHKKVGDALKFIRDTYGDFFEVIAGNVCTPDGASYLYHSGADIIKIGVGPGSHCTTRIVTGHGIPQLTAILKCREALPGVCLIADGGIRNSGDIAKALVAGADYVMIGRLLAGCAEAPSEAIMTPKGLMKVYRGSASYEAQSTRRDKRTIIAEGVQSQVPYTGTVQQIITKLTNGLKSACSYTGAATLREFKESAKMIRVTGASFVEGTPHGA